MNQRPTDQEYAPYYGHYIGQAKGDEIISALRTGLKDITDFAKSLSAEKWNHRYAPDKWTIKEALIHVIDAERVFAYRALRIGRRDTTPMPGFSQNEYVPYSRANDRSPESVIAEYQAVRQATLALFQQFNEEDLLAMGTASEFPVSCRALGFIIAGHEQHHLRIFRERYL